LPTCHIILKSSKPETKPYPKELITYGDHLRKKRLDLSLHQQQVAKIIHVTTDTITNWELNRTKPDIKYIPSIISFLGYTPTTTIHPIKEYRIQRDLTQKTMACPSF